MTKHADLRDLDPLFLLAVIDELPQELFDRSGRTREHMKLTFMARHFGDVAQSDVPPLPPSPQPTIEQAITSLEPSTLS
jgi:hypothetical protein